jgi:hypothetical protein
MAKQLFIKSHEYESCEVHTEHYVGGDDFCGGLRCDLMDRCWGFGVVSCLIFELGVSVGDDRRGCAATRPGVPLFSSLILFLYLSILARFSRANSLSS